MNLINDHIKLKKSVKHIKILLVALALSTAISIGTLSYVLYQQQGVIEVWNMIMNDIGDYQFISVCFMSRVDYIFIFFKFFDTICLK